MEFAPLITHVGDVTDSLFASTSGTPPCPWCTQVHHGHGGVPGKSSGVSRSPASVPATGSLALSDRIAVFDDGAIQQVGTASELYERPRSLFVAEFLGESSTVRGHVEPDGDDSCLRIGDRTVRVPGRTAAGGAAAIVVRPEHMRVQPATAPIGPGTNALSARVSQEIYLGSGRKLELALPDGTVLLAREQANRLSGVRRGDEVTVVWEVERGVLLDDTSGTTPPPTSGGRIPVAASAEESGR